MTRDLNQNMNAAIWVQQMAETLRETASEWKHTPWGRDLTSDVAQIERLDGRFVGGEA
ncbi:hypothetical protein [Gluconobacter frateurii]|uniref:Uncharacterized protein n=1 Tax=Gluconobacter frateurii NRIC 0228 TaxID=1307946 RepID=A0ABQ0QDV8_9PROT|nr:hypothetical protein [Gluconobacter frateurii]GBR15371.1 hypothetical protein AA0228_2495 [Gluconobacter frateurii NRIC 0228]GLP90291.1 hypothetical protein GCM10007868_13660 [Gluconobacter frateurii]